MQISQHVRVRGARWRVADVRPFDQGQIVTLAGLTPPNLGVERRVLTPFDVIDPIERPSRPRVVGARRWRRACGAVIAGDVPPGALRSARRARVDVMPHQLSPALAAVRGLGSRMLLADAVGLGKTIQAGLVIAELFDRGWLERVLVLTPAGLRDQWIAELRDRFGIAAAAADAASLRIRAAGLPIGINPWTTFEIAVASIDYVKRGEVLPAAAATFWDAIVVDEAHGCAGGSDRHDAVDLLAGRAPCVVLITATPHSGDSGAFASLCAIGSAHGDPLLVFRRTRRDVGLDDRRRVHSRRVHLSPGERRMHTLLVRYGDAVRAERAGAWLALSVLYKRALSSPWSLLQSVERRLAALADDEMDGDQLVLPLGDPTGEFVGEDQAPGWPSGLALSDRGRERAMLSKLADAARDAARREAKLEGLRRLLRRIDESAVVFTEYRDTLLHVQRMLRGLPIVVLHGGMTRDERGAALAAFARERRTVLLATDAAGEGLNLHATCRLVVNLELPWNPMRLEQRIGRVDRIGQQRTVHAWHLIAEGTGETLILERLKHRIARAQADIGAPDPLAAFEPEIDERSIARMVVTGMDGSSFDGLRMSGQGTVAATAAAEFPSPVIPSLSNEPGVRPPLILSLSKDERLTRDADTEARRLFLARGVSDADEEAVLAELEARGTWLLPLRRGRLRRAIGIRSLLIWQAVCEDACGRIVETRLVPLVVDAAPAARIEDLIRCLTPRVTELTAGWRADVEHMAGAFAAARRSREQAIAARWRTVPGRDCQRGLFDRRADRAWQTDREADAEREQLTAGRMATLDLRTALSFRTPALRLAILPAARRARP